MDNKNFTDVLNFNYKFRDINSKTYNMKEYENIRLQSDIFKDVDRLIAGNEQREENSEESNNADKSMGVLILEISYSVGLILGVTIFFNHFGKRKVTLDPTPIEVQMRLYEEQVETTVIRNASRKESGVDTQ